MKGEKLLEMTYFAHRQAEKTTLSNVVEPSSAQKLSQSAWLCSYFILEERGKSAGIRQEMSETASVTRSNRRRGANGVKRGEPGAERTTNLHLFCLRRILWVFFSVCSV